MTQADNFTFIAFPTGGVHITENSFVTEKVETAFKNNATYQELAYGHYFARCVTKENGDKTIFFHDDKTGHNMIYEEKKTDKGVVRTQRRYSCTEKLLETVREDENGISINRYHDADEEQLDAFDFVTFPDAAENIIKIKESRIHIREAFDMAKGELVAREVTRDPDGVTLNRTTTIFGQNGVEIVLEETSTIQNGNPWAVNRDQKTYKNGKLFHHVVHDSDQGPQRRPV